MKAERLGLTMAHLVMEAISKLQRYSLKSTTRAIKTQILEDYGDKASTITHLIPTYVKKGLNLGLIARYGDNYRTKMYVMKRAKRKPNKETKKRRRRRKRSE